MKNILILGGGFIGGHLVKKVKKTIQKFTPKYILINYKYIVLTFIY